MATSFFISMGLTSVASRGFRGMSTMRNTNLPSGKQKVVKPKTNKNWKLTFDEVTSIRKLDDEGVPRKQIFEDHVKGKMSYEGMRSILDYVTRVNA